jgi:hypothetical protein
MLIQLSLGIMNLAVMVIVAAVIALEKLVPRSEWIVWTVGGSATAGGLLLLFKA